MSRLVMAVCDTEDGYRERFVTYLVEHKSREVAVHAFSAVESFLETVKQQQFDVVICGRGFAETKDYLREMGILVLVLQDTMPEKLTEPSGYEIEEAVPCVSTFRYQPIEAILHEVQVLAGGQQMESIGDMAVSSRMEVIGVYSPMHHEMQMPFSVVLAEVLSKKRKILYVNLTKCSGFLEVLRLTGEYDLGDIILRLRNKRLYPETFLRSVYEMEQIYYIPPFVNPENLHDFSMEDYLTFLGFLQDKTDFEVLLLDFGDATDNLAGMLAYCTTVYCPMKAGYFFECQWNQFMTYLDQETGGEVREKLHRINLPFSAKHIRGGDVCRQLLWSEFGDYVREYLTGVWYESDG